jgi:hypothetical protein
MKRDTSRREVFMAGLVIEDTFAPYYAEREGFSKSRKDGDRQRKLPRTDEAEPDAANNAPPLNKAA